MLDKFFKEQDLADIEHVRTTAEQIDKLKNMVEAHRHEPIFSKGANNQTYGGFSLMVDSTEVRIGPLNTDTSRSEELPDSAFV